MNDFGSDIPSSKCSITNLESDVMATSDGESEAKNAPSKLDTFTNQVEEKYFQTTQNGSHLDYVLSNLLESGFQLFCPNAFHEKPSKIVIKKLIYGVTHIGCESDYILSQSHMNNDIQCCKILKSKSIQELKEMIFKQICSPLTFTSENEENWNQKYVSTAPIVRIVALNRIISNVPKTTKYIADLLGVCRASTLEKNLSTLKMLSFTLWAP
eukprot:NODE_174_length_14184_cov_0.583671.p9 type:complete len:212 gc:universal NODE_174_length_14184_cov_0.583671:10252-9617(-)